MGTVLRQCMMAMMAWLDAASQATTDDYLLNRWTHSSTSLTNRSQPSRHPLKPHPPPSSSSSQVAAPANSGTGVLGCVDVRLPAAVTGSHPQVCFGLFKTVLCPAAGCIEPRPCDTWHHEHYVTAHSRQCHAPVVP